MMRRTPSARVGSEGTISIGIDHENGNDTEELVRWQFLIGPRSYAEDVVGLFAWAILDVHEETYDDAEYNLYVTECSTWDEGDQYFRESYEEWKNERIPSGIRPYRNDSGEVDVYRLEMTLTELGKSFLSG